MNILHRCAVAFFALMLMSADCYAGRTIEGVVRSVYDGDTIQLATRKESHLKIRLYGIDAPETAKPDKPGQPSGATAKRALMYKIMGRQVTAEIMDVDQYKRAVAVIRYSGRDINREMVAEGMAWAYRQYLQGAYTSEYLHAEQHARSKKLGLWRDSNPTAPWDFRRALEPEARGKKRQR